MSDEGKSVEALEKRVATLSKGLEEFQQLVAKGKQLRWILVVALLIVVGVVVFMMVGLKNKATNVDTDKLVSMINERMQVIVEAQKDNLMNAIKEAYPQVTKKIEAKISEEAPKLQVKAEKEMEVFIANLKKGVDRQVEKELKAMERAIRATVKKEFPDLNDEKVAVMVTNFQNAINTVCIDFAHEYFQVHASVLLDIDKSLKDDFKATKADNLPAKRDALIEELKSVVVRLFNLKLVQLADTDE
ncbi:MAG: hypothetical protein O3B01_23155 [Planctomycetota bacterium]|nr:hypothetical protein [Planctomycetota bacterium]